MDTDFLVLLIVVILLIHCTVSRLPYPNDVGSEVAAGPFSLMLASSQPG